MSFNLYATDLKAQKSERAGGERAGHDRGEKVVYLNDLTAELNESDFVRASGTAGIEAPYSYDGRWR